MQKPVVQKITVKSMNQKIRRVGQRFGIDSLPYKQLVADIDRDFRGMTHYTKEGIIQVTQSKKTELNDYQKQIVNRVAARQGVKEITAKAKIRLKEKGVNKPTAQDINQNVKEFTEEQTRFDKALDLIYDHQVAGDIPTDLDSTVDKLHRALGLGVTEQDVDFIIKGIYEFDDLRTEVDEINSTIAEILNGRGESIPEQFANDIWNVKSGQYTLEQVRSTVEKMREYYDKLLFDPDNAKYE